MYVGRGIARGGMGEVFLTVKEGLGGFQRLVVVKRLLPSLEADQNMQEMFLREGRLAAALHHPNVVQITDVGHDDHGFFMAMEYLSGENLHTLLRLLSQQKKRVPIEIACEIISNVAAGLHSAHSATDDLGVHQPIVHRDVTPSNIVACYNGAVKLVDFGIAKSLNGEEQTRSGTIRGKSAYLAPEQLEGEGDAFAPDPRADIFQLGIVFHEILTGRHLFKADTALQSINAILSQDIPMPSAYNPSVPLEIDDLVMWMLKRSASDRPASADKVRQALSKWAKQTGTIATQEDVAEWMKGAFRKQHRIRLGLERECLRSAKGRRDSEVEEFSFWEGDFDVCGTSPGEIGDAEIAALTEAAGVVTQPFIKSMFVSRPDNSLSRGIERAPIVDVECASTPKQQGGSSVSRLGHFLVLALVVYAALETASDLSDLGLSNGELWSKGWVSDGTLVAGGLSDEPKQATADVLKNTVVEVKAPSKEMASGLPRIRQIVVASEPPEIPETASEVKATKRRRSKRRRRRSARRKERHRLSAQNARESYQPELLLELGCTKGSDNKNPWPR